MQVDPNINEAGADDWESGGDVIDFGDVPAEEELIPEPEAVAPADTDEEVLADGDEPEVDPDEVAEHAKDAEKEEGEETPEDEEGKESPDAKGQEGQELEAEGPVVEVATDPEKIAEEYQQAIQQAEVSTQDEIASKYIPEAFQIRETLDATEARIQEIEAKYKPDEDGFSAPKSAEDERLLRQLDARVERLMSQQQDIMRRVEIETRESVATKRAEAYIQANVKKFPALKEYESGFREMVRLGIQVDSSAKAIAIAKGLSEVAGGAKVVQAKKPAPGEVERKALESNLASKRKGAITAGKGAGSKSGASANSGNKYLDAPPELRGALRELDAAFARS